MSQWTHVIGAIYIDTCIESKNIVKIINRDIEKAPKITGSEADCDIFINLLSGYNVYNSCDCESCEYNKYNASTQFECPNANFQTCACISIVGDLRDKTGKDTKQEIINFINYLQKDRQYEIMYCAFTVVDELYGSYYLEQNDYKLIWKFKKGGN